MGSFWTFVAVLLFFTSGLLGSLPLLLVSILLLLLAGISRLWARYSLSRLEFIHTLSSYRVFSGEEVELVLQVTNRKALPLSWVEVNDELPQEVTLVQGRTEPASDATRMVLKNFLSLGWYHRVTRRYALRCVKRGHFFLGPTTMRSGDLFGLFSREQLIGRDGFLTVYPRILPVVHARLDSQAPYGNIRTRTYILEDVTRPMGTREYVAGDSLRHIHWKATARLGRLQTRIYDASTTPNYVIFLDVRTVPPAMFGTRSHLLELGVLTTTALANDALEHGYTVGVYVNQDARLSSRFLQVPPSQHPEQLTGILEVMAQVHLAESMPMSHLLQEQSSKLPWGATLLVVAAVPDEATVEALARLKAPGRAVALVKVGGSCEGLRVRGVPTYQVSDETDWRELEAITIR